MRRRGTAQSSRALTDAMYDHFPRITNVLASHVRRAVRSVEGRPAWRAAGHRVTVVADHV